MFFTPTNDFQWSVDNFGSTYSDSGIGLNSPGHANANTKGANTNMLNGIANDCYAISIGFSGANANNINRRNLVDLLIDSGAGVGNSGSSWTVLINNLHVSMASTVAGMIWYYFPIYLKAGTAIGTSNQSITAGTSALRVVVRVYGKPSRPELIKCGTKVQTYGAVTATTQGTAIVPGNTVMGSNTASLGTSSFDQFWWQCGMSYEESALTNSQCAWMDVLAGDGSNNVLCAESVMQNTDTTERGGKHAFGSKLPIRNIKSGSNVYMRAAASAASPLNPTVIAYGLG